MPTWFQDWLKNGKAINNQKRKVHYSNWINTDHEILTANLFKNANFKCLSRSIL